MTVPTDATSVAPAPPARSEIDRLSDQLVVDYCALSPNLATFIGRPGDETRLDDYSPDGLAALNDMATAALTAVRAAPSTGPADDTAREVITERLQLEVDKFASGWEYAKLNVIASPLQQIIMIFDLMPTSTDEQLETIARRMRSVPEALAGYRASLDHGAALGKLPASRQVARVAGQARTHAGAAERPGYFTRLADRAGRDGAVGADLATGAAAAEAAMGEFAEYLESTVLPHAPVPDAVGEYRYALASRDFLGATADLAEAYGWGWEEFLGIETELREVAARITGGGTPAAAATQLDTDSDYLVHGQDGLQAWMQELSDRAVAELGRTHFEIAVPMRTLECRIAPPGQGVGAYYTGPSADFSRPGRMWWSVEQGRETFATWRETTVVYHEGVPGHHLQIATQTYQKERLNDFQRLLAGTSGHAEGWALYAERLVRELGYLDDDGVLLGMLDSQLFRAARVVVDIGMHLELEIPSGTGFHEGERWTPELGLEFLLTRTIADPVHCRDEIDRYLGWPGQAPSYKLGERVWLQARSDARARHPETFDLKAFHTAALNMGGMGLDPLARRLALL